MTLSELFRKYGSDKDGDDAVSWHCYGPLYERLLADRRESVTSVLEIGVLNGASLFAWRDWFPKAVVRGLDNDAAKLFCADRIECSLADQAHPESLLNAIDEGTYCAFDVVVDDGSHRAEDQLTALAVLLHRLRPGGDWFIEDVGHNPLESMVTAVRTLVGGRGEVTVHDLRGVRGRHDDVIIQVRAR